MAIFKKRFSEEFHKEARRQYTSTPRSWEGEEENTAAEEHRKPIHSWLPTEGEPHIKAPWFQHYNNESNLNQMEQVEDFVYNITS